jgi:hypothetical protein
MCSEKLCGIYPATSYLVCTKPFANCRVSMWRNLISCESGPNSEIPLPMRIGILVMINCWISPAASHEGQNFSAISGFTPLLCSSRT